MDKVDSRNIGIFKLAQEYLLSFTPVTAEMLEAQLTEWQRKKLTNIPSLFKAMLIHAQNRQGMPNSIGKIEYLTHLLYEFSPVAVIQQYASWEVLFDAIIQSGYTPPGRMLKDKKNNYWVIYCKAIVSIAKFLSTYSSIEEFNTFVEGFSTNEYSRLALPLLLQHEIFGFGFALACDFLKENGYPQFIKPDTHIKEIAYGIGITHSTSDFQIFKDTIKYCESIQVIPYEVDKLFWLVGSGRFYLFQVEVSTSKKEFIKLVNQRYPL